MNPTPSALPDSPAGPDTGAPGSSLLRATPVLVGVVFVFLYARAAAPGILEFFDDSLEFQYVLPTLGIAHPTGYPLYTLLGALWSRVLFPAGEWAWRVNLLSALCAGATVGVVCAVGQRLIRPQSGSVRVDTEWTSGGALLAAIAFGLGSVWWAQATVAEVYALHNLFVALALLLALRAGQAEEDAAQHRALLLLSAAVGLSLAHHRTTVLLLPGLLLYLLWSVPTLRRPSRRWLLYAAALLLPLLLYAYIPLRAAMGVRDLNAAYEPTWQGFWAHVLASRYGAFFGTTALAVARSPADWLALAVGQVGWAFLALAAVGLPAGLLLRGVNRSANRSGWLLVLLLLLGNLGFALLYRVADVEVFLLPVWMMLALAAGNGIALLARVEVRSWALAYLPLLLLLMLLFQRLDGRLPVQNRSGAWAAHDLALHMAAADFPPGSRVLGLEGEITALRYVQRAHGAAAGVETIAADDEAARRAWLDASLADGVPVYLTRELPGTASAYSFSGEGALVRVWPRGETQAGAPATPLDERFAGGALALLGVEWRPLPGAEGRTAELALYWQPQQPLTQTLKLSLRPQNADGTPVLLPDGTPMQKDHVPLRGTAATPDWVVGETVRDVYTVPLLPGVPGATLAIIVYDAATLAEVGRLQTPLPSR